LVTFLILQTTDDKVWAFLLFQVDFTDFPFNPQKIARILVTCSARLFSYDLCQCNSVNRSCFIPVEIVQGLQNYVGICVIDAVTGLNPKESARVVNGKLLLIWSFTFVVEQTVRVLVPCHRFDIHPDRKLPFSRLMVNVSEGLHTAEEEKCRNRNELYYLSDEGEGWSEEGGRILINQASIMSENKKRRSFMSSLTVS